MKLMAKAKKAVTKAVKKVSKQVEKFSPEWHALKEEARKKLDNR